MDHLGLYGVEAYELGEYGSGLEKEKLRELFAK
jgi:hypothetical protein